MKITKLGHCCLLIETKGVKIMTDPGAWTEFPSDLSGIDALLISHEHSDHLHVEAVTEIIKQNPGLNIYTNESVGKILETAQIKYTKLKESGSFVVKGIVINYFDCLHALIYPDIPKTQNTPFIIADRLFYPGDSFFVPQTQVELLALPVSGPWLRIDQAIDYAKQIKPKLCFPVHDGMLKHLGATHVIPQKMLAIAGIEFKALLAGESLEA